MIIQRPIARDDTLGRKLAKPKDAQAVIDQVTKAVSSWRGKSKALKRSRVDVQMMESVFAV